MSRLKNALLALALATALMASASPGSAGGSGDGHGADHDRARQALEAGEVLPLRAILERVERAYPGQIVEVELEREDGRWEYEIKLLRSGGALVKLRVDARDGSIIGVKGRKDHRQGERRGEAGGEQRGEQH
ncbi:MAG: putative membrane protein YkoI [Candidatus Accumulibacter regalis]|jgi:Predicted membrane protein|nr:PepSY domain-containing protein [Accumulibacter sp.]